MAMLRNCKLVWKAIEADHVVGYRIYWSSGPAIGYDSNCIDVGRTDELAIPDQIIAACDGSVMFGITAIDRDGNESDMTTIAEPVQFQAPMAPGALRLQPADEYIVSQPSDEEVIEPEVIQRLIAQLDRDDPADGVDKVNLFDRQKADHAPARFDIGSIF